jgi:hypothetical protein
MHILPQQRMATGPVDFWTKTGAWRLLIALASLVLIHSHSNAQATQTVLLSWDASPDPSVVGYNVYYGTGSGNYTNIVNVGGASFTTIPGIVEGKTYYFAVTAFDLFGQESVFSNEVNYTGVIQPAVVSISVVNGVVSLTGTGSTGHVYEIQATTNFVLWQVIGIQTAGASGTFSFTPPAENYPMQFFRFRDTSL